MWISLIAYVGIDVATLYPAPHWWMYRFGTFSQLLAISYITSFMFYYVTVHLPNQARKSSALKYVTFACSRIVALWRGLAYRFQRSAEGFGSEAVTLPDEATLKRWFDAMADMNAQQQITRANYPDNIADELMRRKNETLRIADELLGLYVYELDHELFDILTELKASRLMDDIDLMQHSDVRSSLTHYSDVFFEYVKIVERLMNHQRIVK